MQAHMPFALISCLCFSGALVWIYSQTRNSKPWLGQGLRFGVAAWAMAIVPPYLTNYVIEPWPGVFVAKILAWEFVAVLISGALTARLAKKRFRCLGSVGRLSVVQDSFSGATHWSGYASLHSCGLQDGELRNGSRTDYFDY